MKVCWWTYSHCQKISPASHYEYVFTALPQPQYRNIKCYQQLGIYSYIIIII